MTASERPWRGVSLSDRQTSRRQRLFDAVLEISDAEGLASLTVRRVCAEAGLTSRYFYESFTDTADLLTSLYDELAAAAIAEVSAGVLQSNGELRDRVRSGVNSGAVSVTGDPRTIRFLLVSATARPDLNARRRQLIGDVTALGAAAALHGSGVAGLPPSVEVTARFVMGGLLEVATALVEGDVGYSMTDLVDASTEMVLMAVERARDQMA